MRNPQEDFEMIEKYIFTFGEYDDSLLNKVVSLFSETFYWTNKFSTDYLKWQYIDNPNGKVVSFNAFGSDGTLAAHYAAIPIYMQIDGEKELGLLSLNTATHPYHQGHRLFTTLADMTYNYAKKHGYKYVIGVANANSTHGFLKYLGFYQVASLDFKVGVGDVFKSEIPTRLNRVLWDIDTLKWRLRCPEYKYSAKGNTIYSGRPEPLFHASVAKMPKDLGATELGLRKSSDVFNIYIGLGANTKNGNYFNLPKFIKRSPFNLIFKDLTEGQLPKITRDNIFFTLLDFDVA